MKRIDRKLLVKFRDRLAGVGVRTRFFHPQHLMGKQLLTFMEDHLPREQNLSLLDIGCGTKPYRHLRNYAKWYGVDVFDGPEVDEVISNTSNISLATWEFDVAICTQVLEHVDEPLLFISEVLGNLKAGTLLLINTPFIYPIHGEPFDFHRFTPYLYTKIFSDHEVIEIGQIGGVGSSIATLINNWINRDLPHRTFIRIASFPILSVFYAVTNVFALLIDRLDRTKAFPTNIYAVVRIR